VNEVGYKYFKSFHQHAAKEAIAKQPSVDSGGALGGMISGEVTPQLPWRELLSEGLVQGGFARLVTSLEMLVIGRQINALCVGRDVFEQDIWYYVPQWFKDWVLEKDLNSTAHGYLEHPDFLEDLKQNKPLAEAFAMAYADQDLDAFNDCFRRYVSRNVYYGEPSSGHRPPVFLGRRLAYQFFDAVNEGAETFQEFLIKDALQPGAGVELLEELASQTTNPFLLCKLVDVWAKRGEKEVAVKLLERAEAGTDAGRLIACPWARWQIFGDQDTARRIMEGYIDSPGWVSDCERLQMEGLFDLIKLFEDVGGEEPCLSRFQSAVESNAKTIRDWEKIIGKHLLAGQADQVDRYLELASELPENCQDWNRLAAVFGGEAVELRGQFMKCMKRAVSMAQTREDWEACLENWFGGGEVFSEQCDCCVQIAWNLRRLEELMGEGGGHRILTAP